MRVRENIRKRDQSEEQRAGWAGARTRPGLHKQGEAGSKWVGMSCHGSLPFFPCPVTKASNTTERVCLSSQETLVQRAFYHKGQTATMRMCQSPNHRASGTPTWIQSLVYYASSHPLICYPALLSTTVPAA